MYCTIAQLNSMLPGELDYPKRIIRYRPGRRDVRAASYFKIQYSTVDLLLYSTVLPLLRGGV